MNDITYAVSVDVNNPIIPYNVYVASVLDSNVRYLEITLYQNGNVITLSNTATATASLVTDNVLVDDSVNCTISNNIITVPLEGLQRNGNLDVQVTVTEGEKVLAIPFPIQVRVTPNIAEEAQIDENSLGSYAEVVQEIAEARNGHNSLDERLNSDASGMEAALQSKAGKAETLAGYGITDAYTKTQTNNLLDGKSNASHTHSQYLTAHQDISGKLDKLAEGTANKIITSTAGGAVQRSIYSASSTASNITNGETAILPTCSAIKEYVLEELERGEYVDENALFDAINTAFTGGGTLVPSIAIDNDNQSGDCIFYYVDGDFVRHDIFNFSQYFITEPYNLYDPCAAYTVTDASQTSNVGYSVDSGTGSITVTRALGDGQKYIRYADKTLKAGTYTLSGKVTLHSNAADGNRTMCCNIGYEKTWQQVNLTTERGGSQNIGSSDKEGWFSCTVTLSYDQVFSFEAIPWSVSVCNSNLPAVLSNVQIIEGADIGAYSPAARTSVDIKARTLIGKRGDELASDIAANTTALKNRNGVIYTTATARHSYTVSTGGVINFTVGAKLNTRLYGDNVKDLDWNTVGSEISGSLTVNNETATIRLTENKALVYNTTGKKLYIRSGTLSTSFKNDDILLIYNGYGVPLKGRLYDEYIERKAIDLQTTLTRSEIAAQSFNSAYHTGATDFASKCTEFSSLFYGDTIVPDKTAPADFESFLFFTDPHLLNGTGWESKCTEMIAQIQKYYNSTPTHFILCGGDWIGNNDLPSEACFKLGYINGFMSSMFDNCRMLVGNHDLNYQGKATAQSDRGTTRLSNQSISDLWYKGGKAYYSFDGLNTRFYCFDTGSDGDSMNAYFWEQAQWFANALDSENSNHIAIAVHILYKNLSASPKVMSPLTAQILTIAQAFNNRGTVTVNGTSHNYEGKTGKIEFLLGGHTHADYDEVINGIPCVLTTQVKPSSASEATFDLVCVDYSAGKLKMIRIGDGSNREFSLSA